MNNKRIGVVIPAAGVGARMAASIPKQYLPLGTKTILEHSVLAVAQHPCVVEIVIAVSRADEYIHDINFRLNCPLRIVEGGKERADSVLAGCQALSDDCDWVLVHDAARPCLQHNDLDRLIRHCFDTQLAGLLASPVRDTMKRETAGVISTVDREHLWHALTPQLCPREQLSRILQDISDQGVTITDESSALEWAGVPCQLVEGLASNIKVTRPEDLALAEFYLQFYRG